MSKSSVLLLLLTACGSIAETDAHSEVAARAPGWTQFGGTAQHGGIQHREIVGLRVTQVIEQDPGAAAHEAQRGFYQNHQSQALSSDDDEWVFFPKKRGWTSIFRKDTQTYSVDGYRWVQGINGRMLLHAWSRDSSWRPSTFLPNQFGGGFGTAANGYEPLFQPALVNGSLYVPAANGAVERLNRETGAVEAIIRPFAGTQFENDPATIVSSTISHNHKGNVYYTVVAWAAPFETATDPHESWLVRVNPDNSVTAKPWSEIAVGHGIKGANDLCSFDFQFDGGTVPPSRDAVPPQAACGIQRPAINAGVSFMGNGDPVVLSASNDSRIDNYVLRLDQETLAPLWAGSTRARLPIGCGVLIPFTDRDFGECPVGTREGVDPWLNELVSTRSPDLVESHILITPDDDAIICGYAGGFVFGGDLDARGSCLRFTAGGSFAGFSEYGWEVTPALRRHTDGSWSMIQDRNRFSDFDQAVVQLSPDFSVEWETRTGEVGADDTENLNGQLVVDAAGNSYGVDADGFVTKYGPDGAVREQLDLGTGYRVLLANELTSGPDGTIFVPFAGKLYVVRGGGPVFATRPAVSSRRRPEPELGLAGRMKAGDEPVR